MPDSAGLHVQIGDGTRGFSLPLLRNLAVLTSCFEQQWNQVHPPHRLFSAHCRLPSDLFQLEEKDRRSMARTLYSLKSIDELIDKMHMPRAYHDLPTRLTCYLERGGVVNFLNLKTMFGEPIKRTVEFRQQVGTMDEFESLRWIVTAGAAVKVTDGPSGVFWDVIQSHVQENGDDD